MKILHQRRLGIMRLITIVTSVTVLFLFYINLSSAGKFRGGLKKYLSRKLNNNSYFHDLAFAINQTLKVYQPIGVTVHSYYLDESVDYLTKTCFSTLPTLKMAAYPKDSTETNERTLKTPSVIYDTGSLNVVFLPDDIYLSGYFEHFDSIQLVSNVSRPRVLFLLSMDIQSGISYQNVMNISKNRLIYLGVMKDFAEATLIIFDKYQRGPLFFAYCDFYIRAVNYGNLKRNFTLFPNKMKNMGQYPFKVAPLTNKKFNRTSEKSKKHSNTSLFIWKAGYFCFVEEFFCKRHNCNAIPISYAKRSRADFFYGNVFLAGNTNKSYVVTFDIANLIAAIPHLSRINNLSPAVISSDLNINLSLFILVVICLLVFILLLLKIFRFEENCWKILDIYICILGSSLEVGNSKKEKVLYFVLILLSFYFSNVITDLATQYEFNELRVEVKDYKDLSDLGKPVYSTIQQKKMVFATRCWDFEFIPVSKTGNKFYTICILELYEKNDRICVENDHLVEGYSAQLRKKSGKGLRKAGFIIKSHYLAQLMRPNSFYRETYQKIVLQAFDSGILRTYTMKQRLNLKNFDYYDDDYDVVSNNDWDLYYALFKYLLIAHVIGAVVLLFEFILKKFGSKIEIWWTANRDKIKTYIFKTLKAVSRLRYILRKCNKNVQKI